MEAGHQWNPFSYQTFSHVAWEDTVTWVAETPSGPCGVCALVSGQVPSLALSQQNKAKVRGCHCRHVMYYVTCPPCKGLWLLNKSAWRCSLLVGYWLGERQPHGVSQGLQKQQRAASKSQAGGERLLHSLMSTENSLRER